MNINKKKQNFIFLNQKKKSYDQIVFVNDFNFQIIKPKKK